jgi:hypothetical protein
MYRLVLVFWLAAVPPVYSWGVEGHTLVARLAAARLTPKASAAVARILGPDATLASISTWADQVRNTRKETGAWHYIDIQITDAHLDMKRDCPQGNCVLTKIEEFEKVLKDKTTPSEKRKEALMFLVHFVGDMHQPLHCADRHDKGGNDTKLTFFGRPTNLHGVWDSGLLARIGPEDALYAELNKNLSPKRAKKFAKGDVKKWAEQSHRQAQLIAYGKLPKAEPGAVIALAEAYQQQADPIVKEQLEEAGARLAKVLNNALK